MQGHTRNTDRFANVAKVKYLGSIVTNQNLILDEINSRLNSGIACYHSVQNLVLLVCCLLLPRGVGCLVYKKAAEFSGQLENCNLSMTILYYKVRR
jgi:hypothetical protein